MSALTGNDIRDAIQAAALADHYELADQLACEYRLNVCRHCADVPPIIDYQNLDGAWPVCGPCHEQLAPEKLVFRPGGESHGNVFTDWPSLVAALKSSVKTIAFDDEHGPCTISAGQWNVAGCKLEPLRPLPAGFDIVHGDHRLLARVITAHGAVLVNPRVVEGLSISGDGLIIQP